MDNPLLAPSPLPYELPPFDRIADTHYLPAIEAGIEEQRAELEAVLTSPADADFGNTIVALERSGATLHRAALAFHNIATSHARSAIQELETVIAPLLAAHQDNIFLNRALSERVHRVPLDGLDAESARLTAEYQRKFIRAGAELGDAEQSRLRALNTEISELGTAFQQRLLADTNTAAPRFEAAADLDGLAPEALAAADAAEAVGLPGSYLLPLVLPTAQPVLEILTNRESRRRVHEASTGRGSAGGTRGTLEVAARLAALRAQRAALLGFESHAEAATDDQTAPSLQAIRTLLEQLAPVAVRNARAEALELETMAGHPLEPWDWSYYSAKVRNARYDVDLAALRPYFELESVLTDGVFHAASQLFGITFTQRPDLSGYHPDVRVWEVHEADGTGLGLFLGDYFARETKSGGAWMNALVEQSTLEGTRPVVVNNLNISRPAPGKPALLSYDEVVTVFHEFGHALHGLFSRVTYRSFSGTNVPRDYVEYPSQVNEMWALWPEVVTNYARHHATGEPLPQEVVNRLVEAQSWGEGFATTEYLAAALLDLSWHSLQAGTAVEDPAAFEAQALAGAGLDFALVPPRYRTGYFKHIFAGGYAASYYAYIWSEVLDADTVEWFTAAGGLNRTNGDYFRAQILSRGFSVDPLMAYRQFRGRDADVEPLLHRRGLG